MIETIKRNKAWDAMVARKNHSKDNLYAYVFSDWLLYSNPDSDKAFELSVEANRLRREIENEQ